VKDLTRFGELSMASQSEGHVLNILRFSTRHPRIGNFSQEITVDVKGKYWS